MSKAGDVIVKLLLKSDEYEKGLRRGRSATDQFASAVTKGVSSAIAKFTAIAAAVTAVIGVVAKLSQANQQLGDAWGRMTAAMSASWDMMFKRLATLNFSNLIRDIRTVASYARDAYDALDSMGEINTSYNISMARYAKEIAQLRIDLQDMTKSDEERIAAGEKLLTIYNKLEKEPTRGLGNVMNTTLDDFAAKMRYAIEDQPEKVMEEFRRQLTDLFVWLGTEQGETAAAAAKKAWRAVSGDVAGFRKQMADIGLTQAQINFVEKYNRYLNDKDRIAIEQAVVGYYEQEAKVTEETRRIQTQINSLRAKQPGVVGPAAGPSAEELELQRLRGILNDGPLQQAVSAGMTALAESMQMPDLFTDEWLQRQEAQTRKFEQLLDKVTDVSMMFGSAVQSGIIASIDELANAVSAGESIDAGAMISALLSPLADACIAAGLLIMTTGEGIEALRDTLLTGLVTGGVSSIVAGAALMAAGAAAKIGLAAIASGSRGSAAGTVASTPGATAGTAAGAENIEMTVHIEGLVIKGSDLVLATDRARAELGR